MLITCYLHGPPHPRSVRCKQCEHPGATEPGAGEEQYYQTDMTIILYMLPQRERGRWFAQDQYHQKTRILAEMFVNQQKQISIFSAVR